MVDVKFKLNKRDFIWIGFITVLLGTGFSYAYGSSNPNIMGHSAEEITSIDWNQITNRPAGLDDGDQIGITSIDWNQITNRPAGLDDGDQIGSSSTNTKTIYSCPEKWSCDDGQIIDGAWGSYGCAGQISTTSSCTNLWWNNGARSCQNACTLLGNMIMQ